MAVKNKFMLDDSLEIMTPTGNLTFRLAAMENGKGEATTVAPGDGHKVWLPVPEAVDLAYALLLRNFTDGSSTREPYSQAAAL